MQSRAKKRTRRRGASMVETAIILLVLLGMVLASCELMLVVIRRNALSEAARRAARAAIVHGDSAGVTGVLGPATSEGSAAANTPIAAAARQLLPTMNPADVLIRVEWLDGDNEPDDRVRVTLRYDHDPIVPEAFDFGAFELQATSTMKIVH